MKLTKNASGKMILKLSKQRVDSGDWFGAQEAAQFLLREFDKIDLTFDDDSAGPSPEDDRNAGISEVDNMRR